MCTGTFTFFLMRGMTDTHIGLRQIQGRTFGIKPTLRRTLRAVLLAMKFGWPCRRQTTLHILRCERPPPPGRISALCSSHLHGSHLLTPGHLLRDVGGGGLARRSNEFCYLSLSLLTNGSPITQTAKWCRSNTITTLGFVVPLPWLLWWIPWWCMGCLRWWA